MAKKNTGRRNPQSKRSQGIDRHTKPRVLFHPPADLHAALKAAVKDTRRTMTAEIVLALEKHLASLGHWPPPPPA